MKWLLSSTFLLGALVGALSPALGGDASALGGDSPVPGGDALGAGATQSRAATSLFDLKSQWRDDRGRAVRLSRWKGRWLIASLAYTRCPSICAVTIEKLKRIEQELGDRKIDILVFSMDPDGDTPQAMKAFKAKKDIDRARWHFLAGEDSETRQLAERLGMRYGQKSASPSSHIMHTIRIVLVSPEGKVAAALDGPEADPASLRSLLPR